MAVCRSNVWNKIIVSIEKKMKRLKKPHKFITKDFGNKKVNEIVRYLKKYRFKHNLLQVDMAKMLGMSRNSYARIESRGIIRGIVEYKVKAFIYNQKHPGR